jgi:hypothetical protein
MDNFENTLIEDETQSIEKIEFLTPMDVAKLMNCSIPTARQLFYRADFPTIKVGKNLKVLKSAFIDWCGAKRM